MLLAQDIEIVKHYFKALESGLDKHALFDILSSAPIFEHYHKLTDTFEKINEDSILMTSATIWETIIALSDRPKVVF